MPYSNYQPQQEENLEKLSGIVKRITFHSSDSGWTVLKINPFDQPNTEVAVTIYQSKVFAGASVDFWGNWVSNPKYGMQFKAEKILEKKPASINALEKYLGSGLIKGVGPKTAKTIVKYFKNETLEIFDKKIHRLLEVPGIAKLKLETIQKGWTEHQEIKEVMMFLQTHEISTLFAVKIFKLYGQKSIEIVSQNPYKLAEDIYGIGFFSADKVALSLGFEPKSEVRIKAAISQVLASSRENGHCYLTLEQIQKNTSELLSLELFVEVENLLDKMDKNQEIKVRILQKENQILDSNVNSNIKLSLENQTPKSKAKKTDSKTSTDLIKAYYSPSIYFDENYIAQKVLELSNNILSAKFKNEVKSSDKFLQTWIKNFCLEKKIELSDEQTKAVFGIYKERFSILTGAAGCGKTTTVKVLVSLILSQRKQVILAAPTGRAAQRMMEVVGIEAKTIHRLLEWQPQIGGFKKNQEDNLHADFLILDETSMLDVHLTASVLRAIGPKTQVLFIGDYNQLPAVGAGNILKDLILSGVLNCFNLTKIFRQAKDSSIIRFAHEINTGHTPLIMSPFANPQIWKTNSDCMFVDSEEITKEQMQFVQKIKRNFDLNSQKSDLEKELIAKSISNSASNTVSNSISIKNSNLTPNLSVKSTNTDSNLQKNPTYKISQEASKHMFLESENLFIPDKFKHINLEKLLETNGVASELREILKKVHPWSSLNYNLIASQMVDLLYNQYIPKYRGKAEIQVLSPMTRGSLGTASLNKMIQNSSNPASFNKAQITLGERIFRVGDRIIQKKNNYDLDVFNGDIGKIVEIDNQDILVTVEYNLSGQKGGKLVIYEKDTLNEIDLAYAITIHKSQGSEFEVVILPITTQHFNMLYRNLLYTGITRGKKLVIFVGSRRALSLAVKNLDVSKRQTALKQLLQKN